MKSPRCQSVDGLDRRKLVVVNLHTETAPETAYNRFDRLRVLLALTRIIAILDELAGYPPTAEEKGAKVEDAEARGVRHRQGVAEPDPPPKRLNVSEARAALGPALGLPHRERR